MSSIRLFFLRICCLAVFAFVFSASRFGNAQETQPPTLKSLETNAGKISPGFNPSRTEYTLHVPHRVDAITLTLTPEHKDCLVMVNDMEIAEPWHSEPIEIEPGLNLCLIDISTQDTQTKNRYTLKVIRAYPMPDWVQVKETSPWIPRDSAGELVFQNRMWLFGGYTPPLVNDVWISTDGVHWENIGSLPNESGINIPINLVYKNKMWITSNDGCLFSSSDGSQWTLVTKDAPWRGRYGAGGVVFQDKMWVMGGSKDNRIFNDVWSSTNGMDWTLETPEAGWSKRQPFGMLAVHQDKMWLLGGGISKYHPFKAYNDVWSSSDGKNWKEVTSSAPWPARIWGTSAVYRNRIWVFTGFHSEPTWSNLGDVWYSSDGEHWHELKTETIWGARHEASVYVFHDRLWVAAGNFWPLKNDVWSLEIPGLTFLTSPPVEEYATAQYTYAARADFNQSCTAVNYRLVESPSWLTIDAKTGLVRGTPDTPGDFSVTIEAFDTAGESVQQSYVLHVMPL